MLAARAHSVRAMAENIPSPCISVCKMTADGTVCQGCLRSIDEIRDWSARTDQEKKTVWARIEARLQTQPGACP
ncbi:MAG: DUF1289 domain-containing protein [Burkholderiales bacterium]|nr:DUF1289 domain-containing protein [Burkholderiales bacterium]